MVIFAILTARWAPDNVAGVTKVNREVTHRPQRSAYS